MPYSSLAPSFLSYFHPTYFISIMAHLYSLFDLYIPYGNFNFILVLVLQFPDSLNLSFHNLSIHQFSRKDLSLAQFIPKIYNKIIIKILGYFWGVTHCLIPGNGAIKLVETKIYTQIYSTITRGLLSNPRQRRHKTCWLSTIWTKKSLRVNHFQFWFWPDILQVHRSTSNKMDISPDIDPT